MIRRWLDRRAAWRMIFLLRDTPRLQGCALTADQHTALAWCWLVVDADDRAEEHARIAAYLRSGAA